MATKQIHIHLQAKGGRGPIGHLVVHADEQVVRMLTRRVRLSGQDRDPRDGPPDLVRHFAEALRFSINEDSEVVHAYEARGEAQ